jgi:hypothetical protein
MRLIVEPTEKFFMAGDVMVRMWGGNTDNGTPVLALIAAVVFPGEADATGEGLVSIPPPEPEDAARWAREIMLKAGLPP